MILYILLFYFIVIYFFFFLLDLSFWTQSMEQETKVHFVYGLHLWIFMFEVNSHNLFKGNIKQGKHFKVIADSIL